jgi:hypothetical protein
MIPVYSYYLKQQFISIIFNNLRETTSTKNAVAKKKNKVPIDHIPTKRPIPDKVADMDENKKEVKDELVGHQHNL